MTNRKIRALMVEAGLRQWQVAALIGMREETLCRKMREELDEKTRNKIETALRELIEQQEKEDGA